MIAGSGVLFGGGTTKQHFYYFFYTDSVLSSGIEVPLALFFLAACASEHPKHKYVF